MPDQYDDETCRMVGDTLTEIFGFARDQAELRQCYERNKDVFDRLNTEQKDRLRKVWADTKERLK